jgi:hypothetical protein
METTTENSMDDFKIWFPYEIFYIESMLTVTTAAMTEQSLLRNTIEELQKGKSVNDDLIIDMAQNIINRAASISRYFWPSRSDEIHKGRGQRLREAFEISDSNPIKDKNMRNFIEHFDERLDVYLSNGIAGSVIPSYVGNRITASLTINHFFRAFYLEDWTFQVLGLEFKLQPIINELIRIHLLLEKFKTEGGRLPKISL